MNLHGVAVGAISAVNPPIPATLSVSTGYTTNADGTRTPTYSTTSVNAQVQNFTALELQHLNTLNINGVLNKVYLSGDLNSVVRFSQTGGDMLNMLGCNWLVVHVLENWPDWSCVAVSQQLT